MNETGPSVFVSVLLFFLFFLALSLFPLAEVALALYRRAVVRSMGGARRSAPPSSVTNGEAPDVTAVPLTIRPAELAADWGASSPGEQLYSRVARSARATTLVYTIAGLAYAAVMGLALCLHSDGLSWWALPVATLAFAWPTVLTAWLIGAFGGGILSAVTALYFIAFWLTALQPSMPDYLTAIFLAGISATVIAWIVHGRRIRAVAPLIAAFLSIQLAALILAMGVTGLLNESGRGAPSAVWAEDHPFQFLSLLLLILAGGLAGGWVMLRWVGRRYERKQTSDQTITMSAIWLFFAVIQSCTLVADNPLWMLAGCASFAVFVIVSTSGFAMLRRRGALAESGPRLLILRVFALGRRSRRLFDALAAGWRQIGSLQLIAGPDLASSTVEPHEFLDFLRRRLAHRFVDSDDAIDARLAQVDSAPDHDGRFRITEFFCGEAWWRAVLGRLVAATDVVLMDLRGFSASNAGCVYELGELLNLVPLGRVVVVVDDSTDEQFLSRVLADAWVRMPATSPNRTAAVSEVRTFRESKLSGVDHRTLLRLLCETQARTAGAAVTAPM